MMAVAGSALECAGRLPGDAEPAATVPSLRAALLAVQALPSPLGSSSSTLATTQLLDAKAYQEAALSNPVLQRILAQVPLPEASAKDPAAISALRGRLRTSLDILERVGARVLGLVMTKMRRNEPIVTAGSYGYGYGYGIRRKTKTPSADAGKD